MEFTTAVATCFAKYATFSGRARRAEFWWFTLFNFGVLVILSVIDLGWGNPRHWMMGDGGPSPVGTLYWLAVLLPSLAVTVRRLHDIDRTGWWILIHFLPLVGPIVMIWFLATPGTAGPNRFGPDPLGPPPGPPWGEAPRYGPRTAEDSRYASSTLPKVPRR